MYGFKIPLAFGEDHICCFYFIPCFITDVIKICSCNAASIINHFHYTVKPYIAGCFKIRIVYHRFAPDNGSHFQIRISILYDLKRDLVKNDFSAVISQIDELRRLFHVFQE